MCALPQYQTYEHAKNISYNPPSGIDYYNFNYIPEFTNTILEACLSRGGLKAYKLNATGDSVISTANYLIYNNDSTKLKYGRLRDVCVAPNGDVYFIAFDRKTNIFLNSDADIRVMRNPLLNSISNDVEGVRMQIIPNPANDNIRVILNETIEQGSVLLKNIYGETIFEKHFENNHEVSINAGDFTNGFYFLTLNDNKGNAIKSQKVIVVH